MTLPGLPYMHAAGDGGVRQTTQVVIIHATDNTASAEDEAGYATHRPDQTSAHVYVDDDSAVQALRLDHIAYGALWNGNQISVQLELSGRSNAISDATMRQAAPIVAEICRRYNIPVRKISAAQVRAGQKGICGHADITAAFPQDGGDHTDPGAQFPWAKFISYVADGGAPTKEDPEVYYTSVGRDRLALKAGQVVNVQFTDGAANTGKFWGYDAKAKSGGYSVGAGGRLFTGDVTVELDKALPAGAQLATRFVETDPKKSYAVSKAHPWGLLVPAGDGLQAHAVTTSWVDPGKHLWVQLRATKDVTLLGVWAKVGLFNG